MKDGSETMEAGVAASHRASVADIRAAFSAARERMASMDSQERMDGASRAARWLSNLRGKGGGSGRADHDAAPA